MYQCCSNKILMKPVNLLIKDEREAKASHQTYPRNMFQFQLSDFDQFGLRFFADRNAPFAEQCGLGSQIALFGAE